MPELREYQHHLQTLKARYASALAATGYDAVLLGAGLASQHFLDDQGPAFKANAMLLQWLPLTEHPGALLLVPADSDPLAVIVSDDDYWHKPPEVPAAPWSEALEIRCVTNASDALDALGKLPPRLALLGPAAQWQNLGLNQEINPTALIDALHYQRSVKTPYELNAMRRATASAVDGHRAALQAFTDGCSEFDILMAFLAASRHAADDLPYHAIIAGDRNAAILHYQHYQRQPAPTASLLIDAGCSSLGYASDITRSYAAPGQTDFAHLIAAIESLQQGLCAATRPGVYFADLQARAHRDLATLLAEQGLIAASADEILAADATSCFLPHGLGHLLGVQVHDVGGDLADAAGTRLQAPPAYPRLRLLRQLEPGQVLTIEPGLYFIDSLLEKLRSGALGQRVDWPRIEALRACGGIRIEDNLLVTADGNENLTRLAFAA